MSEQHKSLKYFLPAYSALHAWLLDLIVTAEQKNMPLPRSVGEYLDHLKATTSADKYKHIESLKTDLEGAVNIYLSSSEKLHSEAVRSAFDAFVRELQDNFEARFSNGAWSEITRMYGESELRQDYDKETERLHRYNEQFSLCLLRSNSIAFDEIGLDEKKSILKHLGDVVHKNMRLFDSAYHLEDDLLLVSLKHTDDKGALNFLKRVQSSLDDIKTELNLAVTGCIAEPVAKENIDNLMRRMKRDLGNISGKKMGDSFIVKEVSPLQQFIEDQKEGAE